jgi:DNA modification methylase
MEPSSPQRRDDLTFRGNLRSTRHGWLRLTPAYSVKLVGEILDAARPERGAVVLDPFCGTGTTALVCAERGIAADTTDINPFLVWLARAKSHAYSAAELRTFRRHAGAVHGVVENASAERPWCPALHQIEKWWDGETLLALGRAMAEIRRLGRGRAGAAGDLLQLAFCRTMIERANVSFAHQSMSFKRPAAGVAPARGRKRLEPALAQPIPRAPRQGALHARREVARHWDDAVSAIAEAAGSPIEARPEVVLCDARELERRLASERYSLVITSPPYPNRMSYIRELRPYMYWLGYLRERRDAGELDWQAIGGTWGAATARVAKWRPAQPEPVPYEGFEQILARIGAHSVLLSRYVAKYFQDMAQHCRSLARVVRPGGSVHYIVGNSKFYDVLLPVEHIFAALFQAAGFERATVEMVRKRTSKRELFEFLVSARKP